MTSTSPTDPGDPELTAPPTSPDPGADQSAPQVAAEEGKRVGGVAADEAKSVAAEAGDKARDLASEALGHLSEQSRTQLDKVSALLRSFGDDLEQMASGDQGSGVAGTVAQRVADRAHSTGARLEGADPADLVDDLRSFARRRPGVFLGGALAAGIVAGRFARGMKGANDAEQSAGASSSPAPAAARPAPSTDAAGPGLGDSGLGDSGQDDLADRDGTDPAGVLPSPDHPSSDSPVSHEPLPAGPFAERSGR